MAKVLQRSGPVLLVIMLLSLVGPLPRTVNVAAGDSRYFPETGQTSSNAFYQFWLAHGQTEILGLPITPPYVQQGGNLLVQIYERATMEWHPENTVQNRVQLQLLGNGDLDSITDDKNVQYGSQYRAAPPRSCAGNTNCETFPPTKHTMLGAFRDFWYAHGGLATFGYPLTEEFKIYTLDSPNTLVAVQFFERNRLEWHPEINGGAVLLGRLGARQLETLKSKNTILASTTYVPDYDDPGGTAPQPPVTASGTLFSDAQGRFSFRYPQGWSVDLPTKDQTAACYLIGPNGTVTGAVFIDPTNVPTIEAEESVIRSNLSNSADNVNVITGVTNQTIGGEPARFVTYESTPRSGTGSKRTIGLWVVLHQGMRLTYVGIPDIPQYDTLNAIVATTTFGPPPQPVAPAPNPNPAPPPQPRPQPQVQPFVPPPPPPEVVAPSR